MEKYPLFDLFRQVSVIVVEEHGNVEIITGLKFKDFSSYETIVKEICDPDKAYIQWYKFPCISSVILIHRFKLFRFNRYDIIDILCKGE